MAASTLQTITFEGVPEGSNLSAPPHEIPDTCARYVQDFLLDDLGMIRNRGTIQPAVTVATFTDAGVGLAQTINPAGTHKIGVLHGANKFAVTSDDYTTTTDVDTSSLTLSTSPYSIVDSKPALGGGALIGVIPQYGTTKQLAYWRGADKALYSTGGVTVTRGSATVTGTGTAWTTHVVPGMFLYAGATETGATVYMGVVQSVQSDTSLTLEAPSYWSAAANPYTLRPLRSVQPHYRCRLTSDTASTALTGSSTKFTGNLTGTATLWHAFRASDNAYIGKVSTIKNDTTLTLAANALISVTVEDCLLVKGQESVSIAAPTLGALSAVYSERQWYADGNNAYFSEASDFEGIDLDPNSGNFVPMPSTKPGAVSRPITAMAPAYNALFIAKENECFAVTGATPSTFQLRKLQDDGALSGMSVQVYDGNVIFAGREGIYAFDGSQVTSLVEDRLGSFYKKLVRTFSPSTYRMWSMVDRDHYFLFIESVTSPYGLTKGSAITTPTRMTISIYLPTRAVTFQTNMDIRGAIELPASTGKGTWFLVNTATGARICSATDFFETTARDSLTCVGNTAGPDYYLESKRYALGDDLRKKLFKQLALEYYAGGDNLKMDTILGLNENGTTSVSQWIKTLLSWDGVVSGVAATWDDLARQYKSWDDLGQPRFTVKRIKFLKRSQHLGFRIYAASTNVTVVQLGPWQLGYKLQRPGRV